MRACQADAPNSDYGWEADSLRIDTTSGHRSRTRSLLPAPWLAPAIRRSQYSPQPRYAPYRRSFLYPVSLISGSRRGSGTNQRCWVPIPPDKAMYISTGLPGTSRSPISLISI